MPYVWCSITVGYCNPKNGVALRLDRLTLSMVWY